MQDSGSGPVAESYQPVRKLRSDALGDTYEVTHPRTPGRFVLWVGRGTWSAKAPVLEAFAREVGAAQALRHPNVLTIFDYGRLPDGRPFVVTEMVEGPDLGERLMTGPRLAPRETAALVKGMAAGLSAAHARGMVHGGLHAGQVLLAPVEGHDGGFPKLRGFGHARLRGALGAAAEPGWVRGMAPEQVRGPADKVDGGADQFALAALAYRMLAGTDPFAGEDALSILYQTVNDNPRPLAELGSDPRLDAVVKRGLSKNRADRYPAILDFARAFEDAALGSRGVGPLPPARAVPSSPVARSGVRSAATPRPPANDLLLDPDNMERAQALDPRVETGSGDHPAAALDDVGLSDRHSRADLRIPRSRGRLFTLVLLFGAAVAGGAYALGWRPPFPPFQEAGSSLPGAAAVGLHRPDGGSDAGNAGDAGTDDAVLADGRGAGSGDEGHDGGVTAPLEGYSWSAKKNRLVPTGNPPPVDRGLPPAASTERPR